MHDVIERWQATAPPLHGRMRQDAAALSNYVAAGHALLAAMPAKPRRDPCQQAGAARVLAACRQIRDRFITRHAEPVYDLLTANRTRYLRWPELAGEAAAAFPGLLPTRSELSAEAALPQRDKDGQEIDQGIFFRGLLRSPLAGEHMIDGMMLPTDRARGLLEAFHRDARLDLGSVLIERRETIAHLTINNQHCLNAEDNRLVDDLETAIDLTLLDENVHVGVLRGGLMTHPRYAGRRVFSAGIHRGDLRDGRISYVGFLLGREAGCLNKIYRGLLTDPASAPVGCGTVQKPWVAAVDSFAIGGGMQLLLVFDMVVAADDAYFSLPAANEGIVPGLAALRLGRRVGSRRARQMILGGGKLMARDAAAALLCDEVVPTERMDTAIESMACRLDSPAVVANRRMINFAEEPPDRFREYLAEFAAAQAYRIHSLDVLDNVEPQWYPAGQVNAACSEGNC
jgi:thioesterase DpgC